MEYYILNGQEVVTAEMKEWAEFYGEADKRIVQQEVIESKGTEYRVSTVFLGIDHAWYGGPPLLFETMVFPMGPFSRPVPRALFNMGRGSGRAQGRGGRT